MGICQRTCRVGDTDEKAVWDDSPGFQIYGWHFFFFFLACSLSVLPRSQWSRRTAFYAGCRYHVTTIPTYPKQTDITYGIDVIQAKCVKTVLAAIINAATDKVIDWLVKAWCTADKYINTSVHSQYSKSNAVFLPIEWYRSKLSGGTSVYFSLWAGKTVLACAS